MGLHVKQARHDEGHAYRTSYQTPSLMRFSLGEGRTMDARADAKSL